MNQRESRFTLHFILSSSCNIQAAKQSYIIQEVLGSINGKKFTNYKRYTPQQGQDVYSALMPNPFLMALPHSPFSTSSSWLTFSSIVIMQPKCICITMWATALSRTGILSNFSKVYPNPL